MTNPIRKGAGTVVPARRREPRVIEVPEIVIEGDTGRDDDLLMSPSEEPIRKEAGRVVPRRTARVDTDRGPWAPLGPETIERTREIEVPEVRIEGDRGPAPGEYRFRDVPRDLVTQLVPEGRARYLARALLLEPWERSTQEVEDRLRSSGHDRIADVMDAGYDPEALGLHAGQGLLFNRADELAAGLGALTQDDGVRDDPDTRDVDEGSLSARYDRRVRRVRQQMRDAAERAPGSALVGTVTGGLIPSLFLPSAGANATLGQRAALGGLQGGLMGELYGTGNAEPDLVDAPGTVIFEGLDDAALGGAVGTAAPVVFYGLERGARMLQGGGQRLLDRVLGRAPIALAEAIPETTPVIGPGGERQIMDVTDDMLDDVTNDARFLRRVERLRPQAEEVPSREIARRISDMQRDMDPFLDEGIGPKAERVREIMNAEERAALGLPDDIDPNGGLLPMLGRATPRPAPAPAARPAAELPPTNAGARRGGAALLPEEVATQVDDLPLGAQMRGRGAQLLPDEAIATEVDDAPAALARTAPGGRGRPAPQRIETREIPSPQREEGGASLRQYLEPRIRAAGQAQQAQGIIDELDRYSQDPANLGRGVARRHVERLRALLQRAQQAQQVGDRAQMFTTLDEIKRTLGRIQREAGRGVNADPRLVDLAREAYGRMRVGLEDASTWGAGAAQIQRETNAAWARFLETDRQFEQRFLEDVGQRSAVNPWETTPVARASAVDDLVENAQGSQGQEARNVLRRHMGASAELSGQLQRHYGGPEAAAGRVRSNAQRIDALVQLEEMRRPSALTSLADRLDRAGGGGMGSQALRWLGGATDEIPNTPVARELRAIADAAIGRVPVPEGLGTRALDVLTRFADFAQRAGRGDARDLARLWAAYQRMDPEASDVTDAMMEQARQRGERLGGVARALETGDAIPVEDEGGDVVEAGRRLRAAREEARRRHGRARGER